MGLRERKKQETRQLISDVATGLFLQRGFDAVTVAEVAVAANVSTKTVFNYFPRKEDLFLDRFAELVTLVTEAVGERPAGQPVLHALRDLLLDLLARRHPLSGHAEPAYLHFWQVVIDSPALQNRAREFVLELEDLVTRLFAEAEGIDPASVRARFAGAMAVAAYRTVYLTNVHRMMAGGEPADVAAAYREAFAAVDRALSTGPGGPAG